MRVIGITGKAGSGKDSLASFLVENHGFKRIGLADPLREFVSRMTGIPFEDLMQGEVKETPLDNFGGKSPRQMMQTLGTEWGRQTIADDTWLQVAAVAIRKARQEGYAGVVIPDVRFDNEAHFVHQMGGDVVEVIRYGAAPVSAHVSESGVGEPMIDRRYFNDGPKHEMAVYAATLTD